MLHFETHTGQGLEPYLSEMARLRMQVFREFPYLYEGDLGYEKQYLSTYLKTPQSLLVLAWDREEIVGVSTGMPLAAETPEVKAPFEQSAYDIAQVFYCGESVLLPTYRGQGAGVAFFKHREHFAREQGFTHSCFCAVQRPQNHPLRPETYVPLDAFWQKRGYRFQPDLHTHMSWREVGETEESPKPMAFWVKKL